MRLTFAGAAREVTGSCHSLKVGGRTILLDYGMFQGRRTDTRAKNATVPIDVAMIEAVVLSHAHIDNSGRLPLLAQHGFHKPIPYLAAARDLLAVMLADSAHIQEKDTKFLARRRKEALSMPYRMRDTTTAAELMVGIVRRVL